MQNNYKLDQIKNCGSCLWLTGAQPLQEVGPMHGQYGAGAGSWLWIRSFLTHRWKVNVAISLWFWHGIEASLLQLSA